MFLRDKAHAEQLARWGLADVTSAMAFPARIGPPQAAPGFRRVAGGTNDSCYRLEAGPDEPAWQARPLFLKQLRFDPPTWRYLLRPSRVTTEAVSLVELDRLGIPCPRVVAAGEVRQAGGIVTNTFFTVCGIAFALGLATLVVGYFLSWLVGPRMGSMISQTMDDFVHTVIRAGLWTWGMSAVFLIMGGLTVGALRWARRDYLVGAALIVTAIEPSQDLWQFAHENWNAVDIRARSSQIRRLAEQLALQLAVAHKDRFIHNDMKFRNLLVCWPKGEQPGGENVRLAWIDCPRGQRVPPGPLLTRGRIRDLANLNRNAEPFVSRTQRLRFLMDYLRAFGGERAVAGRRLWVERIVNYNRARRGE